MSETRATRFANVVILATAGLFALSLLFALQLDVHFLRFRGQKQMFSRAPVLAMVDDLGIPVIDVHRVFLAQPNPDGFRYNYDSHFTEEGYRLTTEAILNGLKAGRLAAEGG